MSKIIDSEMIIFKKMPFKNCDSLVLKKQVKSHQHIKLALPGKQAILYIGILKIFYRLLIQKLNLGRN